MILAEKIMSLRKRMGWSQEELANQLHVSRQSVSKWESASSIPDITKITQMSEVFGVSTDYLLKDDFPDDQAGIQPALRSSEAGSDEIPGIAGIPVTLDEASEYMDLVRDKAPKAAFGVALCVWSSILLILLGELSAAGIIPVSETISGMIGLSVLLIMVAAAVFIFIVQGRTTKKYDFLETEAISLQYGVEAAVLRRRENFENTYHLSIAVGVVLIILGVIPVAIFSIFEDQIPDASSFGVCIMLFAVGCAVYLFVKNGSINDSFEKLLQEGDHTPQNKAAGKKIAWFPGVYWGVITALYLGYSFITNRWDNSWIIWPVAGAAFGAIYTLLKAKMK